MKRRLLQFSMGIMLAGSYSISHAQITIDQADFPVATTSHRSNELHVSNDSNYTNPTDGANQIWDYQGLITGQQSSFPYAVTRTTPFEITVAAFGLNNTPGFHKRIAYNDRAVTGSGKLVMTHPVGQPSDSMDVLLVKATEVRIDSFFVGGAPAPTPLLQGLGLTQGQMATTYKSYYS